MARWIKQIELAQELNAKPQTIQHWVKRGRIKSKVVFGITVVDANSIKKGKRGRPKVKK